MIELILVLVVLWIVLKLLFAVIKLPFKVLGFFVKQPGASLFWIVILTLLFMHFSGMAQ